MTALRRRMLEDMQVRHLSAGTQQVYLQHIGCLRRSLLIGQLYLRDRGGNDGLAPGTLEQ